MVPELPTEKELATEKVESGAIVPIPTFTEAIAPFTPLILPNTMLLLCPT